MSDSTLVLYHSNCPDGFAAAWVARQVLGPQAVYVPVQYGKPYPPEIDGGISRLLILDFSYPLETLLRLNACASRLVVIDHHQTAEGPVREFAAMQADSQTSSAEVVFDQAKSGVVLTWEYFHPGEPVPMLLRYVQDRDLWKWELDGSREINALIGSYPFEFETWDRLAERVSDGYYGGLVREGEAILRYQEKQVELHTAKAALRIVGGYEVPVVNATTLMSEIGEALCIQFPERSFSATFFVREDGKRVYSLRSRNGFDVSEVAKKLGGGGHKAAAGFTEG